MYNFIKNILMARKTVTVKMHRRKPRKFLKLLTNITEHHTELGAASPLQNAGFIDMTDFETKRQQAQQLYDEAVHHNIMAQSKMNEAYVMMGFAAGQTTYTEGTLYYDTVRIASFLKNHYKMREETLSQFGYDVIVGRSRSAKKKD
jgi:hypothetical protein